MTPSLRATLGAAALALACMTNWVSLPTFAQTAAAQPVSAADAKPASPVRNAGQTPAGAQRSRPCPNRENDPCELNAVKQDSSAKGIKDNGIKQGSCYCNKTNCVCEKN